MLLIDMPTTRKIRGGARGPPRRKMTRSKWRTYHHMKKSSKKSGRNYNINTQANNLMSRAIPTRNRTHKMETRNGIKRLFYKKLEITDNPYYMVARMRKILSTAIDRYSKLQKKTILTPEKSREKRILHTIFMNIGKEVTVFAAENDVTDVGSYAELDDKEFLTKNTLGYMEMFHDYLKDFLNEDERNESHTRIEPEEFEILVKLQEIIFGVLRPYLDDDSSEENVPAVNPEVDALDNLLKDMKV